MRPTALQEYTDESWRPIPRWTHYEASNLGQVRRRERDRSDGKCYLHPLTLSQVAHKGGTRRVTLTQDGRKRNLSVHLAVLAAWVGQVPDGHVTAWRNGNRADNRLVNIHYVKRGKSCSTTPTSSGSIRR